MMHDNLLDLIGNTPLVRVKFPTPAQVYAKLEYFNPGGSIKDRSARFMIEQAEKEGRLKPGGTIIEASSGNQGIAAAMIGAVKGYKVIITASKKVSVEKRATLKAYGVELIECEPTLLLTDPKSYHGQAMEIHRNTPNSIMLNQYFNPENSEAHYRFLGPELWKQTEGKITHFIGGAGSCGTICGAGKYLKEKNPQIKILGVDSVNSFQATNGNPKPYALEGMGIDYETPLLDPAAIDGFLNVADADAISMLKIMARKHGLLIGPASGAVAQASYEYAQNAPAGSVIVMLFGDSGRAYLTKNFYEDVTSNMTAAQPVEIKPSIQV